MDSRARNDQSLDSSAAYSILFDCISLVESTNYNFDNAYIGGIDLGNKKTAKEGRAIVLQRGKGSALDIGNFI